ncbi:MAG: L,D-transpeptidase family protein [Alphaproteobacteria bacterium]
MSAQKSLSSIIMALATGLMLVSAAPADSAVIKAAKKPPFVVKTEKKTVRQLRRDAGAASTLPRPVKRGAAEAATAEGPLPLKDIDENIPLPPYPAGARTWVGESQAYSVGEEDTFADIARHFGLGYVELRAANPGVDPWAPLPGDTLVIPSFNLLPRAKQEGIVVNLGKMRMYYFNQGPGRAPLSFALGIGREGLETPVGETRIVRKLAGPTWFPTPRMKKDKPWLPSAISPGAANPLGTHALYLGWPEFLIHGSNKPWGIGRRVSSGCMRMYPEDIVQLFAMAGPGTKVTVVDQPVLVGWVDNELYLEANPSKTQSNNIEVDGAVSLKPMSEGLRKTITEAAGEYANRIDWSTADRAVRERRGYPVLIAVRGTAKASSPQHNYPSRSQQYNY